MQSRTATENLASVALTTKSVCAQRILAGSKESGIVNRVAANVHLRAEVANQIALSKHEKGAAWALRRVDDQQLLNDRLENGPARNLPWGLRNPLAEEKMLQAALERRDQTSAQCVAAAHPRTSEETRRRWLTPTQISLTTRGDGNPVNRAVRCYTVAKFFMWMHEDPRDWPVAIRIALLNDPNLTADMVAELCEGGAGGYVRMHPATLEIDLEKTTTEQLIKIGSSAVDEYLIEERILENRHHQMFADKERSRRLTPAHLGIMYAKYHEDFLTGYVYRREIGAAGTTDLLAAAWIEPALLYVREASPAIVGSIRELEEILGEDEETWRMFLAMVNAGEVNHQIGWRRRAEAAVKLIGGGS